MNYSLFITLYLRFMRSLRLQSSLTLLFDKTTARLNILVTNFLKIYVGNEFDIQWTFRNFNQTDPEKKLGILNDKLYEIEKLVSQNLLSFLDNKDSRTFTARRKYVKFSKNVF